MGQYLNSTFLRDSLCPLKTKTLFDNQSPKKCSKYSANVICSCIFSSGFFTNHSGYGSANAYAILVKNETTLYMKTPRLQ